MRRDNPSLRNGGVSFAGGERVEGGIEWELTGVGGEIPCGVGCGSREDESAGVERKGG